MNKIKATFIQKLLYIVAFISAIIYVCVVPFDFEYGIFELASGKDSTSEIQTLKNNSSKIRIVLESNNTVELNNVATQIAKILDLKTDNSSKLIATKKVLLEHSNYLLSKADIKLLESNKESSIYETAKNKILSPYCTSLFKISKDPFFLLNNYVNSLLQYGDGWKMTNGFLSKSGKTMLLATIYNSQNLSDFELENKIAKIEEIKKTAKDKGVYVYISGARLHSLKIAKKSQLEINILSIVSLSLVLLLGYIGFGSIRIFIPIALCLGVSFVIALAGLMLIFPKPHICVLIFATSLIGLSIDYSYHYFSACKNYPPQIAYQKISSPLSKTYLTTVLCFAILSFADINLLREISIFSIIGLTASYLFVKLFYPSIMLITKPKLDDKVVIFPSVKSKKIKIVLVVAFVVVSVCGITMAKFKTEAKDLYTPAKDLLNEEKVVAQKFGDTTKKFAIIKASSIYEILSIEEEANIEGISKFLPSIHRQNQNANLIKNFYTKYASTLQKELGAKKKFTMPENQQNLSISDFKGTLIEEIFSSMLTNHNGEWTAIIPIDHSHSNLKNIKIFNPLDFLNNVFNSYMRSTSIFILLSFILLTLTLIALFKKDFIRLIIPILFAITLPISVLALFQININLFHFLGLFILMGLGIDYAIFHCSNKSRQTKTAVLISFLTSFVGFGMLAFTSFGAISSLGIILAMGLTFAYTISYLIGAKNG